MSDDNKDNKFNPFKSDWLMGTAGAKSSDSSDFLINAGAEDKPRSESALKKFQCNVRFKEVGYKYEFEAESKEAYIQKVIDYCKVKHNLIVRESDIYDIEEV